MLILFHIIISCLIMFFNCVNPWSCENLYRCWHCWRYFLKMRCFSKRHTKESIYLMHSTSRRSEPSKQSSYYRFSVMFTSSIQYRTVVCRPFAFSEQRPRITSAADLASGKPWKDRRRRSSLAVRRASCTAGCVCFGITVPHARRLRRCHWCSDHGGDLLVSKNVGPTYY